MDEWVSIAEAARKLTAAGDGVERSSLSRYVSKHLDALKIKGEGNNRLVELNTLIQHRNENVRITPQVEVKRRQQFNGSQVDGAARKAQADAALREMDLAERRGLLTRTSEVDRFGRDAIALMRSAFERSVETVASDLNLKYAWDERVARKELKDFTDIGLEIFNQTIKEALDKMAMKIEQNSTESVNNTQ